MIFSHAPRTAHRSVASVLRQLHGGKFPYGLVPAPWYRNYRGGEQVVAVVRHPLDWLVSVFWSQLDGDWGGPGCIEGYTLSINEFRRWVQDGCPVTVIQFENQSRTIAGADRYIRFEHLQTDFDALTTFLGKQNATLPHIGASAGRPTVAEAYNPPTENAALAQFADDLALWNAAQ